MNRWTFAPVLALALLLAPQSRGGESASPSTSASTVDIPKLVAKLGDADPIVRGEASLTLSSIGVAARPALADALRSGSPEVRIQAGQILLRLPWAQAGDADEVKRSLSNYGDLSVDERCERVGAIAELVNGVGQNALFRILRDDPSAVVRWAAATALRTSGPGGAKPPLDRLRAMSVASNDPAAAPAELVDDAPLLAVVGWAWREANPQRAEELLSRAIELEAQNPAALRGQIDFAFAWLSERALEQHRYEDAVRLTRQQAARAQFDADGAPSSVSELFALHAEYGPFDLFWQDVRSYRAYLWEPELLYSFGHTLTREGYPIVGFTLNGVAIVFGGTSPARHCRTGGFLTTHGWTAAAERELAVAIWLSGGEEINAYFQLARLSAERGDELAVAQHLEEALRGIDRRGGGTMMSRTTRFGDVLPWTTEDAWAEVHWHYLRAARAANDLTGVQKHLEELTRLDRLGQIVHKDPGLATDIVPALQETGQTDAAQKCFDAAYKDLHEAIVADPANAEAKNNLAWLCARCGQRLDEAVRLANEAVAAMPENAAYLDTAAEAYFRNGDARGAVRMETRALELRPNDAFMKEQLARFKRAAESNAH